MSKKKFEEMSTNLDSAMDVDPPVTKNTVTINNKSIPLKDGSHLYKLIASRVPYNVNKNIDLHGNLEHVVVAGIIILLNNNSTFVIDKNGLWSTRETSYIDTDEKLNKNTPILFLHDTALEIAYIGDIKNANVLLGCRIAAHNYIDIDNVVADNVYYTSQYLALKNSTITRGTIDANSIIIEKSTFNGLSIGAKETVKISNITNNLKFNGFYPRSSLDPKVKNLTISPRHYIFISDLKLPFVPTGDVNINIIHRIDYGFFSARSSLSFVRCNEYDLLVNGVLFDNKHIKQIRDHLHNRIGKRDFIAPSSGYNYTPSFIPTFTDPSVSLNTTEVDKLVKEIYKLALDKSEYIVDNENQIENSLVLGLVDQIYSRINLYKQVNTIME